jgi:GNAT superfamily N-acetyltransferase
MSWAANFDRLVAAAWPALHTERLGGWRLRHADGVTKRANSVLPLEDPGDVGAAIEAAERFYDARGLPAVFALSGSARPVGLDERLAERGYEIVDPTLVMTRHLTGPPGDTGVRIEDRPSAGWLDLWWSVDGRFPGGLGVAERILTGVPAAYATADGLAVGRAVPQGEWLGIYTMAVAPSARRRGLAREVLRALLGWGHAQGCRRAYLLVEEANAPARALYEREGFRVAGGYHYRVRPR